MASITTILGTDSVSSSRIVINNNFNAINTELAGIAALLNTTNQSLSLSGEIKGGSFVANNGTIDTFKITSLDITANVAATFKGKVTFENAVVLGIEEGITTMPIANSYASSTYILGVFASPILLAAAEDGQEITIIAGNGQIEFDVTNISTYTTITMGEGGAITFRYSAVNSLFYVISSSNTVIF